MKYIKRWEHSSHSSDDSHSNTLDNLTVSVADANPHTATIGGVDWSSSFNADTKIGVKNGTGSLTQLLNIVNNMRSRAKDTTYCDNIDLQSINDESIPIESGLAYGTQFNKLKNYNKIDINVRYQPYTLEMKAIGSGTYRDSLLKPEDSKKQLSVDQTVSQTITTPGTPATYTCFAKGKEDTTKTFTCTDTLANEIISPQIKIQPNLPTVIRGQKMTKETANQILAALQNNTLTAWKGPEEKAFSWKGTNTVTHSSSHSDSSRKIKENIHTYIDSALDIINSVKIVNFNYLPNTEYDPNIKHIGFIAENTPEELSTQYHDRMDYTNCIGLLIKSVQELTEKVNNLEKKQL